MVNSCIDGLNNTSFEELSEYDKFIFGSLMDSHEGNITRRELEDGFADYHYLELFCNNGIKCDAKTFDETLADFASQITFLLER